MRNRKNIKPFENFHNTFEYTNSTIDVNEGFFDMYTIQGIWDMESKMENSGKTAIIIDKDHKRGWFGESYWIFFRFNDGFEDNIKISSDAFQRCRVGDKVTVIYYPDGCRVKLNARQLNLCVHRFLHLVFEVSLKGISKHMERHVWIAQTNNKYGKLELGNRPLLPVQITFNMTQEQIIDRLKWLIQDWKEEVQCLEEMVDNWENHDDPGSDPGLQFEQEMKIERHWKEIADFCKDNLK